MVHSHPLCSRGGRFKYIAFLDAYNNMGVFAGLEFVRSIQYRKIGEVINLDF